MEAGPFRAVGASVIGALHEQRGLPCQDAVKVSATERMLVVALADGHGDKKHARSDVGAALAVEVAAELLHTVGEELLADASPPSRVEQILARHLPRRIQWEWNVRVRTHAGHPEPTGEWHEDTRLYGTTLLASLFVRDLALFFRLGDGGVVVWDSEERGRQLFAEDEGLYGSQTHSLCQADGAGRAQLACLDSRELGAVLLVTDGVTDSLDSDLAGVVDWFVGRIAEEGWETVTASLPDWLRELSARGNGDDVTLGLVQRQGDDEWQC